MRATAHLLRSSTWLAVPLALLLVAAGCTSSDSGEGDSSDEGGDASDDGSDSSDDGSDSSDDGSDSSDDGSDDGGSKVDAGETGDPDAAPGEVCAAPGAIGNEIGVGEFCTEGGDECSDNDEATICTVDFEDGVPPFCTKVCFGDDDCGSDASCEDNGGPLSGCTPACLVEP